MNSKFKTAVNFLKKNDKVMKQLIESIGNCKLKKNNDYFEALVKSIIFQQLSKKAASTIYSRFLKRIDYNVSPQSILALKDSDYKLTGISRQKKTYLIDLSAKVKNRIVDFDNISKLSNKLIVEKLTIIKGIGKWSAEMFLIFSINRLDVFPIDDIGIRKSISKNYKIKDINKEMLFKISNKWKEYSSIACWYLWKDLDNNDR